MIKNLLILKRIAFSLILLVVSSNIFAQSGDLACGGGRYINDVFSNVTVTSDVIYGYNSTVNYYTGTPSTPQTLRMNIYQPDGDAAVKRPVIFLAFGGSFLAGDKSSMAGICTQLAKKGYVTIAIDYRVANPDPISQYLVSINDNLKYDVILKACADMKAAIRFMKNDAATTNAYRIDPSRIIVGGYSAGAIVALHTALINSETEYPDFTATYANNGGIEGDTDLPSPNALIGQQTYKGIFGVLNISGAIINESVIDNADPIIFSTHGDNDETVPYGRGSAAGLVTMDGSFNIHNKAVSIGLASSLTTITGGNHASTVQDPGYSQSLANLVSFYEPKICVGSTLTIKIINFSGEIDKHSCKMLLKWTALEEDNISYTLQGSANGNNFTDLTTIPVKKVVGTNQYSYALNKLADGTNYFRLKINYNDKTSDYYKDLVPLTGKCDLNSFSIYPNPANHFVDITGLREGIKTISLSFIDGREVYNKQTSEVALQINTSKLGSGLYFINVITGKEKMVKKLIIKK